MIKLLFVLNNSKYFISHRLPIAVEAKKRGYEVHIACPDEDSNQIFKKAGIIYHHIPLSRRGMNPFAELGSIFALSRLFKRLKPDLVHLVTIKPYLYGGIAARLSRVSSVVSAVAGLGTLFVSDNPKARIIRLILLPLYKYAFGHPNQAIIFQNKHDQSMLADWSGFVPLKAILIKGSGVEVEKYQQICEPTGTPIITFAARLLKEKGVAEFIEAAKILRKRGLGVNFWVAGDIDVGNPKTITEAELNCWKNEEVVTFLGFRNDIPNLYSKSNIICMPSYYGEGLPKSLIEAAACGRAVITADVPGCRDAIIPNKTGLLVTAKDSESLANAIQKLIRDPVLRKKMGEEGRKFAEAEFHIDKVVDRHMRIYQALIENREK